jgi:hypothetical protein
MEGKTISNPADALYKMSIYMQSWRRNRALLDEVRAMRPSV